MKQAMLTEEQQRALHDFLGEHWDLFGKWADEHGWTEEEAEDLYEALGGER
jgi:hypothetical protein